MSCPTPESGGSLGHSGPESDCWLPLPTQVAPECERGTRMRNKSMNYRRTAKLLACLCLLPLATSSGAWNSKGHMTVAAAAWKDLTPDARAKAIALLRLNPDYPAWVQGVAPADADMVAFVRAA